MRPVGPLRGLARRAHPPPGPRRAGTRARWAVTTGSLPMAVVAGDLAADGAGMTAQRPGDLGLALPGREPTRDLLPLGQTQVPARRLNEIRDHAASLDHP